MEICFYHAVMHQKQADGMEDSVGLSQTARKGAELRISQHCFRGLNMCFYLQKDRKSLRMMDGWMVCWMDG